MSMLRKSSFHGHYCLNTANVWKILSPNTCTWSLHTGSWICKSRKLQNYRYETENGWACYCEWTAQVVQTSGFQAPSLNVRSQGPRNPVLFFQSLLPADFQLPGKELEWEKRNLSFDPIAQTFITVLFFFFFTTYRAKSRKIRKNFFQKRHVLYLIPIERRVGDRNVIIPKL